jgi:hypothetical protein
MADADATEKRASTPLQSNLDLTEHVAEELGVDRNRAEAVIQIVRASYSGPIPPTSEIESLNAMEAGLGIRLVEDHLKQRQHDRDCDLTELQLSLQDSNRKSGWLSYANRGQAAAFASLALSFGAAIYSLLLGYPWVATAFVSPAIIGAVSKFLEARATDHRDDSSSGG